jgi:hypothetical protein
MIRFTIRDLLWLMVVAAMALGWWLEHRRVTPEDREILNAAKAIGFKIEKAKIGGPLSGPNAVLVPGVSHPK